MIFFIIFNLKSLILLFSFLDMGLFYFFYFCEVILLSIINFFIGFLELSYQIFLRHYRYLFDYLIYIGVEWMLFFLLCIVWTALV